MDMKRWDADILVIGSGLAGLSLALKCARKGASVILSTKGAADDTATSLAQGGVAAYIRSPDSLRSHIQDTLSTGKGLSDRKAVSYFIRRGAGAVKDLIREGVRFDRNSSGQLDLGREGGHSFRRIVHVRDKTGMAIEQALLRQAGRCRNIRVIENAWAIDIDAAKGASGAMGAFFYQLSRKNRSAVPLKRLIKPEKGSLFYCGAPVVVLATGGLCALYRYTVNPDVAVGDGVAMAWRAGCVLRDLEFIQFHPTALCRGKSPFFLITEAARGEGARLVTRKGSPIMKGFARMDLEARDIVSHTISMVMKKEPVFLDFTWRSGSWIKKRFSGIYRECLRRGIDIRKEKIPITPAAHYACGGIRTDVSGQTDIPGLFAVGEVASTGLHGANRLASNSLLETAVMSAAAAERAMAYLKRRPRRPSCRAPGDIPVYSAAALKPRVGKIESLIKDILWDKAGIIRTTKGLKDAEKELTLIERQVARHRRRGFNPDVHRLANQLTVAKIIVRSALSRKESRGCHFLEDYPREKASARSTCLRRNAGK
jgi:L-aspartate oxidase